LYLQVWRIACSACGQTGYDSGSPNGSSSSSPILVCMLFITFLILSASRVQNCELLSYPKGSVKLDGLFVAYRSPCQPKMQWDPRRGTGQVANQLGLIVFLRSTPGRSEAWIAKHLCTYADFRLARVLIFWVASELGVRHSSATIPLRVSRFLFEIPSAAARTSFS
jgi:hypothetical protein